jgi:hypothetical protein
VKPSLILPAPVPKASSINKIVASSATHGAATAVAEPSKSSKFDVYIDNKSTIPPPPPVAVASTRRVTGSTSRSSTVKEATISNTYKNEKEICQQFSDMEIVENSKNAPGNLLTHSLTYLLTYSLTYLLTHLYSALMDG